MRLLSKPVVITKVLHCKRKLEPEHRMCTSQGALGTHRTSNNQQINAKMEPVCAHNCCQNTAPTTVLPSGEAKHPPSNRIWYIVCVR